MSERLHLKAFSSKYDVKVKSLNKKLLIDNNITVPTHINSLSTKRAKSYNKC